MTPGISDKFPRRPKAALIDMDGVLYDSMPRHAQAWQMMLSEIGIKEEAIEFHRLEGMTGAATIALIFRRMGREVPGEEEIRRLYARKTEFFKSLGERIPMKDADRMLSILKEYGIDRVLVTGSGQRSLIDSINKDYPGAFAEGMTVTAADCKQGKPAPDPYLKGMSLLGVGSDEAFVIENAPLGVKAGKSSGCFTFGISTGPLPASELAEAGADAVFTSMTSFADSLPKILDEAFL